MTSPYYCPSGRLPVLAIPFTLLCSVAALPGAWLYAWLTIHIPLVYFNFFFTTFFALWLGCIANYVAAHAKVRNPYWMGKLGIVIGLVGWYFQWAAWIAMLIRNQPGHLAGISMIGTFIDLVTAPGSIVSYLTQLFEVGVWEIAGHRIAGVSLIAVWLAELALLLGLPQLCGGVRAGRPFCEVSNTWAEAIELPRKFAFIEDRHSMAQFLETNPEQLFSVLRTWPVGEQLSHSKLTVHLCRGGGDPYISVDNVEAVFSNGKMQETKKPVSDLLRLPGVDPDEVIRQGTDPAPSPSDAASSSEPSDSPELLTAIEHLKADEYEAALDAASPHLAAEQAVLRADARRLCALATSRLGRWNEASTFWRSLFDEEPTAHNALQVATSSVMAGNVPHGVVWIAKAKELNAASGEMPGLTLLTNFVTALTQSGEMKAALPYLDEIKHAYVSLGVTDPTFLYAHRVPFFNAFLENSAPVIRAALDLEQGRAWYTSMLAHLDQAGRDELSVWLENGFIQATGTPRGA